MHKVGNVVIAGLFRVSLLPPANEVCKGYVFTGVCLSTGGLPDREPKTETPWTEAPPPLR